jgi:hypothetical protein
MENCWKTPEEIYANHINANALRQYPPRRKRLKKRN